MKKTWLVLVGLLVILGLGVGLWLKGPDSPVEKADSTEEKRTPQPRVKTTDLRAADTDTLVADDRVGNIRLEGQVVDELMDPVGGAVITINSNPSRTMTSAEDGSFFFDKLVARGYRLVASTETAAAGPVMARISEVSEPIILHLRPAASIEVVVRTALERSPVAGAAVELRGLMSQRATTDAAGVARFRGVAQGFYRVAAVADGYGQAQELLRVSGAGQMTQELLLRPGRAVMGTVRNEAGEPVANAKVLYASATDRFMRGDPRYDAQETDSEGRFAFAAIAPGTFRFTAQHPRYAPGESEPITLAMGESGAEIVVITLAEGAVLSGRVVDADGNPAPLAAVRVAAAGRGRRRVRARQVYTDDDGLFEMTGLARKSMSVVALHENATSATLEANLEAALEVRDVELILEQEGVIAGVVSDSSGNPVDGAQVVLRPDMRAKNFSFTDLRLRGLATGVSDAGGGFEFTGLADGTYTVMASPPGSSLRMRRGPGRADGVLAQVGDTAVEVVIEARGSIVGKVAFEDGSAPEAFSVSLGGRRGATTPFSSSDGAFRLSDLEPGTYAPRLSGPSFDTRSISEIDVKAGQKVDLGTVTVAAGRTLSGRVLGTSGQGVANATVVAGARLRGSGTSATGGSFPGTSGSTKTATTDEDGAFRLRGLASGAIVVVAEHETEGRSAFTTLPVSSDSIDGVDLNLLVPGAVEGKATLNGAAADASRIRVQAQEAPSVNFTVVTGADGSYRFDVLAPGPYLVSSEVGNPRSGIAATSAHVDVESGSVSLVDLAMTTGDVELTVTLEGEGVDFAMISIVGGQLQASTASELASALASQAFASSSRVAVIEGQPALVKELEPGPYSVCATVFPRGVVGPDSREYEAREAERLPVVCIQYEVDIAPTAQAVSMPVLVPELVAPQP